VSPTDPEAARRALGQLIGGYQSTQLIYVAARLRLADHLSDGPRHSADLAPQVGAHPASLRRLMRALAALGVLAESEDGRFALTPLGRHLQSETPDSLHAAALCHGGFISSAWDGLLEGVQRGETAFENVFEARFFDYFLQHSERGAEFDRFMTSVGAAITEGVVAAYDFSCCRTIVDVGGGQGTLLAAILKANPHLSGVLFDQPTVIARACEGIVTAGLTDRCELVAGDFFTGVPEGGDAYLLKWIVHDWPDAAAVRILTHCRRAMGEQSKLLIVEEVEPERITPGATSALRDILMMVLTGGRERTEAQYRALLTTAGLELTRVIPLGHAAATPVSGSQMSLLEARV
jgi:O-methyltransferase domain/Dimerisation domain